MRIQRITAYQVDLPLHEGSYNWSGGKSVTTFDSTVVAVETDAPEEYHEHDHNAGKDQCGHGGKAQAPARHLWDFGFATIVGLCRCSPRSIGRS